MRVYFCVGADPYISVLHVFVCLCVCMCMFNVYVRVYIYVRLCVNTYVCLQCSCMFLDV